MHKIALETTELLPQKTTEPHNPIIWRMDKLFLALLVDGGPKFRASQCFQAVCKRPRVTKDSHRLKSPIPARGELRPKLNLKLPPPPPAAIVYKSANLKWTSRKASGFLLQPSNSGLKKIKKSGLKAPCPLAGRVLAWCWAAFAGCCVSLESPLGLRDARSVLGAGSAATASVLGCFLKMSSHVVQI